MSNILGLCGTHGTGKSTILQGVKAFGYKVNETQLSRAAQKMLGWDKLSIAQESVSNMWSLQEAILTAMWDRDQEIVKTGESTLCERTPADVWAYTAMWCSRLGIDVKTDSRALAYKSRCRELAKNYFKFIQVGIDDAVPFEVDPHRADLQSRLFVAAEIAEFIDSGMLPTYKIKSSLKRDRIGEAVVIMILSLGETVK